MKVPLKRDTQARDAGCERMRDALRPVTLFAVNLAGGYLRVSVFLFPRLPG